MCSFPSHCAQAMRRPRPRPRATPHQRAPAHSHTQLADRARTAHPSYPSLFTQVSRTHLGTAAYFFWRAARDDASGDQDGDPVREAEYGLHVVLDKKHGVAFLQRSQKLDHSLALSRTQPCQWLVQKQQARLGSESRGKLQLALLAMSKHSGLTIRQMTDVQLVQRSRGVARGLALPPNRPPPTSVRLSPRDGRDRHVSMRGEGGEQLRHLIGADEPPSCALMHRHPIHILSCKGDRAHVMLYLPTDLTNQARLSSPVGTNHRMQLTGVHVERHLVGHTQRTEALRQCTDFQQWRTHR